MKIIVCVLAIFCISLSSTEVEAKKGLGSLFKQGRGLKAKNGVKHYNSQILSVAKLRVCLLFERKIDKSEKSLELERPSMSKKEKYIAQLTSETSSLEQYLELNKNNNFYSQEEVERFNNKVKRYKELIYIYNKEFLLYKKIQKNYNFHVDQHNSLVNKFTSGCAGKRYYEDDLAEANRNID